MRYNLSNPDLAGEDPPASGQALGRTLRIASQAIGLVLILAGAYYALWVLAAGISIARDPGELAPALTAMTKTLNLEEAAVPAGESKIPIGRAVSSVVVLLWYLLSTLVALKLVGAGGRLALGVIAERREFLAAMKEFLVTLRAEGTEGQPRKPG
jgi:hypothetical protein